MGSVSGSSSDRASGVARKNPRNGRKCRRCKKFGTFAPLSLVCDRCLGALPLIFEITIAVIVIGGGR
jgi:hypothetical protein